MSITFFDLDGTRIEALKKYSDSMVGKSIEVSVGDCNPFVQGLMERMSAWDIRGVAFLDPYGAHLHWRTLEAIARTRKFKAIINFPVAMAINRLKSNNGEIPQGWRDQLNARFGTTEWIELSYRTERNLFCEEQTVKEGETARRLLNLY